jgi:hypothetical protein
MQNSAEIRFFWGGASAGEIEDWIRSGRFPPGGGSSREDTYLADPRQAELGIKKRGKKPGIEIKGLVGNIQEPLKLGGLTTHGQLWTKWTTEALELSAFTCVTVHKVRWLRKFSVENGIVEEIQLTENEQPLDPLIELPIEGCNLEFTEIYLPAGNRAASTLGLESFGPYPSVEANLRHTLAFLEESNVPEIVGSRELSYPAWLNARSSLQI